MVTVTTTNDLANSALNFAGVALVVGLGFALVMVSVFIIVIAPKLERMVPVEYAGIVRASRDGILDSLDNQLEAVKKKLLQNDIVWDDQLINELDQWLEGKRTQKL